MRIALAAAALLLSLSPALAAPSDPIKDSCRAKTENNAEYRECIAHETSRLSAPWRDSGTTKACGKGTCVFRVTTEGDGKYAGGGLTMWSEGNDSGTTWFVKAPDGRTSKFDRCGTCTWFDYEAGPIKDIDIKFDVVDGAMVTIASKYIKGK